VVEAADILIVESDPRLAETWSCAMRAAGCRVVAAASFEEARTALRAATPDVLVTEIRLGAYNGLHLIIRARASNPKLRAVVITATADPVVRQEAERVGAVHLVKPVDPHVLVGVATGRRD
jgi:two-component system response regulator RegA